MKETQKIVTKCCAFGAAVLMLAATTATASAETMVCAVASGQYVNVRDKASAKAGTYGKIRRGEEIDTESISDGWATITFGGETAFVQVKFFEVKENADYTVEANGRVRYRDAPDGKAAGFYAVGDAVHVDAFTVGADGTRWARIGDRYVKAEFLRAVQDAE